MAAAASEFPNIGTQINEFWGTNFLHGPSWAADPGALFSNERLILPHL